MARFHLGLNERNARFWQLALLAVILAAWHLASRNEQFAFLDRKSVV